VLARLQQSVHVLQDSERLLIGNSIVARSTELSVVCTTIAVDWTLAQTDQFIFDLSDERPRWQLNEQVQRLLPLSVHGNR
jgi:hypothetical protein